MFPARKLIAASLALCGLVIAGCGMKPASLTSVAGKVMFKGTPLTSGLIVFSPDASRGESGPLAVSKIEPDGSYTLKTEDKAGAAAGWYRVTVVSLANPAPNYEATPISYLPDKYRDPQLSQLQCKVEPNRDNHLNFNLD